MTAKKRWGVREPFSTMGADELLRSEISVLQGLTPASANLLRGQPFSIVTIFDLATSRYFNVARDLLLIESDPDSPVSHRFVLSSSVFKDIEVLSTANRGLQSIDALRGLDQATVTAMREELGVENLDELANWPPFVAALDLLEYKRRGHLEHVDPGVPEELVPRFNTYATERVGMRAFTRDPEPSDPGTSRYDALVDGIRLSRGPAGTIRPKLGAILDLEQTWMPTGLALGNLLHSLGLAPGESTRVAVIEWTHSSRGVAQEEVGESTSLSQATSHSRAISEVATALAQEVQSGFSSVTSLAGTEASATSQSGLNNPAVALGAAYAGAQLGGNTLGAVGGVGGLVVGAIVGGVAGTGVGAGPGAVIGGLAGMIGGSIVGGAVGGTAGFLLAAEFGARELNQSTSRLSSVASFSTAGSRSVSASMGQEVLNRTQQVASSVRSRRASIVREVSQKETANLRTRIVTNYNHMHALTIQYFEVLQVNQVKTSVVNVERSLYVPYHAIEEWSDAMLEEYLPYLLNAALNADLVFGLLFEEGTKVLVVPAVREMSAKEIAEEDRRLGQELAAINGLFDEPVAERPLGPWIFREDFELINVEVSGYLGDERGNEDFEQLELRIISDEGEVKVRNHRLFEQLAFESQLGALRLGEAAREIQFHFRTNKGIPFPESLTFRLELRHSTDPEIVIWRTVEIRDTAPFVHGEDGFIPVATCVEVPAKTWIKRHLRLNADYYTRHVLGSLDPAEFAKLLGRYSFEGRPLASVVEGGPIAFSGQHLVFRYPHRSDTEREDWIEEQGFKVDAEGHVQRETLTRDSVTMPSGGIFAEAVQGRATAGEQLDLTRFWDWQSSPIGKSAPEIATVRATSRYMDDGARPGGLGPALVNIQAPSVLPGPQSTEALLKTLGSGGLFRSVAGLHESNSVAREALKLAAESAAKAGGRTSEHLAKALEAASQTIQKVLSVSSEIGNAVVKSGMSAIGGGIGGSGGAGAGRTAGGGISLTGVGGIVGLARDRDARSTGGAGSRASGGPTQGTLGGGGFLPSSGSASARAGTSLEDQAILELVDGLDGRSFDGGATTSGAPGPAPGVAPPPMEVPSVETEVPLPYPQLRDKPGEEARHPSKGLLTAYVSQWEGDVRVPTAAVNAFALGGMQSLGLDLRDRLLRAYAEGDGQWTTEMLFDQALLLSGGDQGSASLACHNLTRTLARGGTFETMALPWQKLPAQAMASRVTYEAGLPTPSGSLERFTVPFEQGSLPSRFFLVRNENRKTGAVTMNPSGFFWLFDQTSLPAAKLTGQKLEDTGDCYHYFLAQTFTAFHNDFSSDWTGIPTEQILDKAEEIYNVLSSAVSIQAGKKDLERFTDDPTVYTVGIFTLAGTVSQLLKAYHLAAGIHSGGYDKAYDAWLWVNALTVLEGLHYGGTEGETRAQLNTQRESYVHMLGARRGLEATVGLEALPNDWRWVIPRTGFKALIKAVWDQLSFSSLVTAFTTGEGIGTAVLEAVEAVAPAFDPSAYIHSEISIQDKLIHQGVVHSNLPAFNKSESYPYTGDESILKRPGESDEVWSSGPKGRVIRKDSADYASLQAIDHPDIVRKNDATILVTARLLARAVVLAELVKTEIPGYKLRVTSGWRAKGDESGHSFHYEGRALDMNVIQDDDNVITSGLHDSSKLGALARLAVRAGFDWVWYEDDGHVHASVRA